MLMLSLIGSLENYMLPCLSKKFLGLECFGCGLQRSVVLLFQGEFLEAFKMYPAIFVLIPLFAIILLNAVYKFKFANKAINILSIISIVVILISYIFKLIK